tara:strand:+ start:4244 stop:4450 length:207 start_codon:yes stop_codon:yes gene_type:complete
MTITFTFNTRSSQELAGLVAKACKAYLNIHREKKRSLEMRIRLVNQVSNQYQVKFETMWAILYAATYE